MIVDVQCEDDTIQIADLIHDDNDGNVQVCFLSMVSDGVYEFENVTCTIPKESVCGWYDVDTLEETDLYMKINGGYILLDDSEDENFTCSESEESDSEDVSLVDEDDEL